MSVCSDCPIEEKIHVCCARYPRNGGQAEMIINGTVTVKACPYLGQTGRCGIYSTRPQSCADFFCERFSLDSNANDSAVSETYNFINGLMSG